MLTTIDFCIGVFLIISNMYASRYADEKLCKQMWIGFLILSFAIIVSDTVILIIT